MKKSMSIVAGLIGAALLFTSCDSINAILPGSGESVKKAKVETVAVNELDAPKGLSSDAKAPTTDDEAKQLLSASAVQAPVLTRSVDTTRAAATESVARAVSSSSSANTSGFDFSVLASTTGTTGFDELAEAVAKFSADLDGENHSATLTFDGDVSAKIPAVGLELSNANVKVDLSAKGTETETTKTVTLNGNATAKAKVVYDTTALTDTILGPGNIVSEFITGTTGVYKVVANTAANAKVKGLTVALTATEKGADADLSGSFGVSAAASVGTTIVTRDKDGNQLYGKVVITTSASAKGDLEKIQAKVETAYNSKTDKKEAKAAAIAAVYGEVKADVTMTIYDKDGKQTWSKKFASAEAAAKFMESEEE